MDEKVVLRQELIEQESAMNLTIQNIRRSVPTEFKQQVRAFFCAPKRFIELIHNYLYDIKRYLKYSSMLQFFGTEQQLRSWIDADAHKLEKGMALPSPRPGFGLGVAERLVREIDLYLEKYGACPSMQIAIAMLRAYQRFTNSHGIDYTDLFNDIDRLSESIPCADNSAGCDLLHKSDWLESAQHDLSSFFRSRRSVRDFSDAPVSPDELLKAIEMARYTPTVCNRQAVKAHAFVAPENVKKVLQCQSGNGGFGHNVSAVLVVTVDRQSFFTAGERNQCWIDGGLFSMSLVYALHSLGLGSCCLNWSATKAEDQRLRTVIDIEESDAVIMMIAVGHLKDRFKVAKSTRKPIRDFITFENIKAR